MTSSARVYAPYAWRDIRVMTSIVASKTLQVNFGVSHGLDVEPGRVPLARVHPRHPGTPALISGLRSG
jgi:hypothetical protein